MSERLPEIPEDATPDERRWIKRQISEGGPVYPIDDPVATRTLEHTDVDQPSDDSR